MGKLVSGIFGGVDDSAQQATLQSNRERQKFIEEQTAMAREDAERLFPAAEANILAGNQAALDLLAGVIPQQLQATQAGYDSALGAILGTGTGQVDFTPDLSFASQILPALRAPENRFGSAADVLGGAAYIDPNLTAPGNVDPVFTSEWGQGLNTNEDVMRAAAQGTIPGLAGDDQKWFGDWLQYTQQNVPDFLGERGILDPAQFALETVGVAGGLNPRNEQRVKALTDILAANMTFPEPIPANTLPAIYGRGKL